MTTTKQAIALLTDTHNEITTFLAGLGLLDNQAAIDYLEIAFDASFKVFVTEYEGLQGDVATASSQVESLEKQIKLIEEYYRIENERLIALQEKKSDLETEIDRLDEQKEVINQVASVGKQAIESKIEEIKEDIFAVEEEIAKGHQDNSDRYVTINTYTTQINELRQQESYYNSLAAQYDQESKVWGVVGKGKRSGQKIYGWVRDPEKVKLRDQAYATAAEFDKQADDLGV